jgi:hypothetical protein
VTKREHLIFKLVVSEPFSLVLLFSEQHHAANILLCAAMICLGQVYFIVFRWLPMAIRWLLVVCFLAAFVAFLFHYYKPEGVVIILRALLSSFGAHVAVAVAAIAFSQLLRNLVSSRSEREEPHAAE